MGLHTEKETIFKKQRFGTVSNGWWAFLRFSGSFYRSNKRVEYIPLWKQPH